MIAVSRRAFAGKVTRFENTIIGPWRSWLKRIVSSDSVSGGSFATRKKERLALSYKTGARAPSRERNYFKEGGLSFGRFFWLSFAPISPSTREHIKSWAKERLWEGINWTGVRKRLLHLSAICGATYGVFFAFLAYVKQDYDAARRQLLCQRLVCTLNGEEIPGNVCNEKEASMVFKGRAASLREMIAPFADTFRLMQAHFIPVELKLFERLARRRQLVVEDITLEIAQAKQLETIRDKYGSRFTRTAQGVDIGLKMQPTLDFEEPIYDLNVQFQALEVSYID